ncbi:hypothetical protein F3Y22_tig00001104pilonHSYRG00017 [Hibiscus syriacus]|uniref:Cytochrome b5 heme-binding domain-containing protein n=1 Tax=Hibiscus syriacus TaxID=106335 RepID=A0A6A3D2T4_HIBSY|nr:hypothetical protein F3Y22_tig00001104pilonHSYRG00017 [Hibiscus syriacus]
MAGYTVYTLSKVAQHKSKKDCWLVIDGRGRTTKAFNDIGHSKSAQKFLLKYQAGVLQGYATKNDADVLVASIEEPKKNEMSAFVIKDDHTPKYAALVEFFLPLLVGGSYLAYRYLTAYSSTV